MISLYITQSVSVWLPPTHTTLQNKSPIKWLDLNRILTMRPAIPLSYGILSMWTSESVIMSPPNTSLQNKSPIEWLYLNRRLTMRPFIPLSYGILSLWTSESVIMSPPNISLQNKSPIEWLFLKGSSQWDLFFKIKAPKSHCMLTGN